MDRKGKLDVEALKAEASRGPLWFRSKHGIDFKDAHITVEKLHAAIERANRQQVTLNFAYWMNHRDSIGRDY